MLNQFYKWLFLIVLIFGGYKFYGVMFEAKEELRISLATANANISVVLENTNKVIGQLSSQVDDIQAKSTEIVTKADENRNFGNALLDRIASSGGEIGKLWAWKFFTSKMDADKWAAKARTEVRIMSFNSYNHDELIYHLGTTIMGGDWYIRLPDSKPVPLYVWLKSE